MTPEMQFVAEKLFKLAAEFRRLEEENSGKTGPVITITRDDTGDSIFIATRHDANIIKTILKPEPPATAKELE